MNRSRPANGRPLKVPFESLTPVATAVSSYTRTVSPSSLTSDENIHAPDFKSARYSAFVLTVPSPCVMVQSAARMRFSVSTSARTRASFHCFSIARTSRSAAVTGGSWRGPGASAPSAANTIRHVRVIQLPQARNMKYTAPSKQQPAHRKSSFTGWRM